MSGFLFEQIVFGPIKSRRLGISLGLNLLPENEKHCTFNCLYCECGWTTPKYKRCLSFPPRDIIKAELEKRLNAISQKGSFIDAITYAGNGEPTIHPDFTGIMEDTVALRNTYFPDAKIVVLSNGTMTGNDKIRNALMKADINQLKLDAGKEETFQKLNNPVIKITLKEIVENYKKFNGNFTVQTLFTKANYKGEVIDNTHPDELNAWLNILKTLKPKRVIIYPIAREAPLSDVEKISPEVLQEIADKVQEAGLQVEVYN